MSHHWQHLFHSARHNEKHHPIQAAIGYIIVGFFLAPLLLGIPIMVYGLGLLCYHLAKRYT